jgi:RNA-directed DNA polymerase
LIVVPDAEVARLRSAVVATFASARYREFYLGYIDRLVSRGLPPILSFTHLAEILGIAPALLRDYTFRTTYFYYDFNIPKRSGGARSISSPFVELAVIQKWIADHVLAIFAESFACGVVGYIKGRNIVDHVSPHRNSECVLKLDLKDFFPSISVRDVTAIFLSIGYSVKIARTLAALVTKDGVLPQGACTSPQLSNIYMKNFDEAITQYCDERKLIYTRYADDIVVSGGNELLNCVEDIRELFYSHGLTLNSAKSRIYRRATDVRFITGLTLNCGAIRLPKAMRRQIRTEAYELARELGRFNAPGIVGSQSSEFIEDPLFLERVLGRLNYWSFIEPDDPYPKRLRSLILDTVEKIAA